MSESVLSHLQGRCVALSESFNKKNVLLVGIPNMRVECLKFATRRRALAITGAYTLVVAAGTSDKCDATSVAKRTNISEHTETMQPSQGTA